MQSRPGRVSRCKFLAYRIGEQIVRVHKHTLASPVGHAIDRLLVAAIHLGSCGSRVLAQPRLQLRRAILSFAWLGLRPPQPLQQRQAVKGERRPAVGSKPAARHDVAHSDRAGKLGPVLAHKHGATPHRAPHTTGQHGLRRQRGQPRQLLQGVAQIGQLGVRGSLRYSGLQCSHPLAARAGRGARRALGTHRIL